MPRMLSFSHMDSRSRSKLSRCLSLVFVISVFLHGLALTSTSIWLSVVNITGCSFLQTYYTPMFLQLAAGTCAICVSAISIVCTAFQRTTKFIRIFMLGILVIATLELASFISAGVLGRVKDNDLRSDMYTSINRLRNSSTTESNKDGHRDSNLHCWNQIQTRHECCGMDSYSIWCPEAVNYTECVSTDGVNLLESCECGEWCQKWDGHLLHSLSCFTAISDNINTAYDVIKALNAILCVLLLVTYWALYCILPRLHAKAIVDTYAPKPSLQDSDL